MDLINGKPIKYYKSKLSRDYGDSLRQDHVYPEYSDLYFLCIEENLSYVEIESVINCNCQKVRRICIKFGLKKTEQQQKEIKKRSDIKGRETFANRTEEQKRKSREKLQNTWKNHTTEEKERIKKIKSDNSKKFWQNLSERDKKELTSKMSISAKKHEASLTKEQKEQRIKKFQETWYSTDEKVLKERNRKNSESKKKWWKTTNKETLDNRLKKRAETYKNKSEKELKEIQNKIYKTKKKNKTLYASKPEKDCGKLLNKKFGKSNVIPQYKSKDFPFASDFYIVNKDLYIDLNFHWTHGKHPFNENSKEDRERLKVLEERQKTSEYYKSAIYTWTDLDVRKVKHCEKNNVNRIVFYTEKEFNKWLEDIK